MTRRVSLAELADADIQLRPSEAVALVIEVCRRRQAGELRGVPSPGVVRLTADGEIVIEGPVTTGEEVALAAQLLDGLLAEFDAVPEYRASGALRLVVGRALGTHDLPPYHALGEFSEALKRFSSVDAGDTARMLFLAWDRARATRELRTAAPAELTISDVRRARRATGLNLTEIATIAEVPQTQLRDLEWGYMRSWRADQNGRAQLVRYARAAGLDERLVVSIAWPMIEEASVAAPPVSVPVESMALVRSGPQQILSLRPPVPSRRFARAGWLAAAAAALLVALVPSVAVPWSSLPAREVRLESPIPVRIEFADPKSAPVVITPAAITASATRPSATRSSATRPSTRQSATKQTARPASVRAAAAPVNRRSAPALKRQQARERSFFNRELFRVVFR